MIDGIKAVGALSIVVRDETGAIKSEKNVSNTVMNLGKNYIAGRVGTSPPSAMTNMGVGTGTLNAGDATQVALGTEIGTRATLTTSVTNNVITYTATFAAGNATGAITEAGIFSASTAGTMMCRTTFSAINKGAADSVTITWTVTIN